MKRYEANRKIREILGLSGRMLAERVEVSKQTISNYENGVFVMKPIERVIEWELNREIDKCTDNSIKSILNTLLIERLD